MEFPDEPPVLPEGIGCNMKGLVGFDEGSCDIGCSVGLGVDGCLVGKGVGITVGGFVGYGVGDGVGAQKGL